MRESLVGVADEMYTQLLTVDPDGEKFGNSVFRDVSKNASKLAVRWPAAGGWLVPGGMEEGQQQGGVLTPVGCRVITAGVMVRGVRHGFWPYFCTTDAETRAPAVQIGRIWPCSRIGHRAFYAAASPFDTSQLL